MASDYANRPVNFVSFWDSCRFANWLTNNQPTGAQGAGTTETGTYLINGYNGNDGRTIQRTLNTTGKTWAVASEDEWYKAAYYKGGGTNAGYWMYPTAGNTAPGRDMNDVSGNNANIYGSPFPIDSGHYTTNAGEFQNSDSAYGTFDQGGNVWEWNEGIPYQDATYAYRGLRGGSFYNDTGDLASSLRNYYAPTSESSPFGFRVSAVPEPLTVVGMLMGLAGLARYVRRRAT